MDKIKELGSRVYTRATLAAAGVGTGVALLPSQAHALPQDYSSVATGATDEIEAVIPVALGILALVIGIPMAIRVFKRISH